MSALYHQHVRAIAYRTAVTDAILDFQSRPEEAFTTVLSRVPETLYRAYEDALLRVWTTERVALARGLARADGRGNLIWNRRNAR